MESIAWMAWTLPTAIFFVLLAMTLAVMTWLAVAYPEAERVGILRIPTTRGDRLFISLIMTAVIHLLWIGLVGTDTIATLPVGEGIELSSLWLATVISLVSAVAIFRTVLKREKEQIRDQPGPGYVCHCNGGTNMRHLDRSKGPLVRTRVLMMTSAVALIAASAAVTAPAFADEAAAKKWIDSEFQPSTLSKDDQSKEMQWFIKAAAPYKGSEINAVSETLTVHEYESKTLTKAFEEITGIKVKHDIIQEGDVVEKIQTQMQSGKNVYDGWINDSDFIGTHFRYGQAVHWTEWIGKAAKA